MADEGHHPALQAVVQDIERRVLDIIKDPQKHIHRDRAELELCCMVTVYGDVSPNLMEIHRILAPMPAYKFPKKKDVARTTRPFTATDRSRIDEKLAGTDLYRIPQYLTRAIAADLGLTVHQVTGYYTGVRTRRNKPSYPLSLKRRG